MLTLAIPRLSAKPNNYGYRHPRDDRVHGKVQENERPASTQKEQSHISHATAMNDG